MPRFKLILEYDGAPFVGWQRQENGLSIQEALEEALAAMTAERATVHGAGRTDAGVHALGQVAHVDLEREWEPFRLGEGLNALLHPHPIAVLKSERVDSGFDARRSASARHYLYRIVNRRAPLALERGRAWRVKPPLDARAMHDAAQALVGRHDFSTFRDAQCQAKSPIRTLDRLDVMRDGDEVQIEASALSFLHRQVRSMVGSLVEVGVGRSTAGDLKAALEAADRSRCGPVAPAWALSRHGRLYPRLRSRAHVRIDALECEGQEPLGAHRRNPSPRIGEGDRAKRGGGGEPINASAAANDCPRPSPSARALPTGGAAVEQVARARARTADLSPSAPDRPLCARFLLREGAAGDRDRRHEPRCRRSA